MSFDNLTKKDYVMPVTSLHTIRVEQRLLESSPLGGNAGQGGQYSETLTGSGAKESQHYDSSPDEMDDFVPLWED